MHSQEFKRKFQVRVVSPNVNYWVVRAGEDAAYLSHFHRNNLVAIGHLDKMEYLSTDLELGLPLVTLLSKYKERLIKEKSSKASATNKSGQVYRFVTEMKVGDVIISLDESNILTGVITSDAYKDSSQKVIRGIDDSIVGEPLTYSLRRNVSWGNRVSRRQLLLLSGLAFAQTKLFFVCLTIGKHLTIGFLLYLQRMTQFISHPKSCSVSK